MLLSVVSSTGHDEINDGNEADEDAGETRKRVRGAEAVNDPLLAIDEAGRLLKFFDLFR